jgi:hypothetical protein
MAANHQVAGQNGEQIQDFLDFMIPIIAAMSADSGSHK